MIATRVGGIPEIFGPRGRASDRAGRCRRARRAPSARRSTHPEQCAASRRRSEAACAANFRSPRWWMAGSPPIARRWRCENLHNSHNQFLNFIHYFAAPVCSAARRPRCARASKVACITVSVMSKPEPGAIFDTASAVRSAVTAMPRAEPAAGRSAAAFARSARDHRKALPRRLFADRARRPRSRDRICAGRCGRLCRLCRLRGAERTASPGITSPPSSASRCLRCWRSRPPTSIRSRRSAATKSSTCGSPRRGRWFF